MARSHLVTSMHNPLCSVYDDFDNIPVYYILLSHMMEILSSDWLIDV